MVEIYKRMVSYEETSTMDNLICKIQAHARVYKENIE